MLILTPLAFALGFLAACLCAAAGSRDDFEAPRSDDIAAAWVCPFLPGRSLGDGLHIDMTDPECDGRCVVCVSDELETLRHAPTSETLGGAA